MTKKELLNTRIIHKRGVWSEAIVNKLKDGEVFYDITGEHGIIMGVTDLSTGKITPVTIAGAKGGGPAPENCLTTDDVVNELEDIVYDNRKVLGANAGLGIKRVVDDNVDKIKKLEDLGKGIISEEAKQYIQELLKNSDLSNSDSIIIETDPSDKSIKLKVKYTDGTLGIIESGGGLGTTWVNYN